MKVAVTGARGFLGKKVCTELLRRRHDLWAPGPHDDFRDERTCQDFCAEQDAVIHLAAKCGGIGYNQSLVLAFAGTV